MTARERKMARQKEREQQRREERKAQVRGTISAAERDGSATFTISRPGERPFQETYYANPEYGQNLWLPDGRYVEFTDLGDGRFRVVKGKANGDRDDTTKNVFEGAKAKEKAIAKQKQFYEAEINRIKKNINY